MTVRKGLDEHDQALVSETIGYLLGIAAALELDRGLRIESTTTPSPEGYAKILAARLRTLRAKIWPIK